MNEGRRPTEAEDARFSMRIVPGQTRSKTSLVRSMKSRNRREEPVRTRVYIPCIAQGKAVAAAAIPSHLNRLHRLPGVRDAEQTIAFLVPRHTTD